MKLIKIEDDSFKLMPAVVSALKEAEETIKKMKEVQDNYKRQILKEMQENGIIKIDTDELTITFVDAYDRETFDSKTLKKELPDIYDAYVKMTPLKPSVRIKVK